MAGPFVGLTGELPRDATTGALQVTGVPIITPKSTAIAAGSSGTTSATPGTSTTPFAADTTRSLLTITASGTADIWIAYGATAAVGSGRVARAGGPGVDIDSSYPGQVSVASSLASAPYAYLIL